MAPRSPTPCRPGAASRLQAPPPAAQAEWGGAQGRGVWGIPEGARPIGTRLPAAGRPGAEGRGGARGSLISSSAAPSPARGTQRQPARVHAAPPASAAHAWARGPAPRRPDAGAVAAAGPPGLGGGTRGLRGSPGLGGGTRGSPGLRVAAGLRAPARAAAAGGARGAALLQLPRGLAQRPASAGRRAAGPRVGECGSATHRVGGDAWARAPVRLAAGPGPRLGWRLAAPQVSRRGRRASVLRVRGKLMGSFICEAIHFPPGVSYTWARCLGKLRNRPKRQELGVAQVLGWPQRARHPVAPAEALGGVSKL